MQDYIKQHIADSIKVKELILNNEQLLSQIVCVANKCIEVYERANKIMLAGNGGSAADAQHIAGEFVSRFYFDRPGLPSIALMGMCKGLWRRLNLNV